MWKGFKSLTEGRGCPPSRRGRETLGANISF